MILISLLLVPVLLTAQNLKLEPCEIAGTAGLRCGIHEVYENRESRSGRRIGLHVIVLPSLSQPAAPDPVFFLAGGPGEAASDVVSFLARLKEIRQTRDIVVVDQRGTGRSNPLKCDLSVSDSLRALTTLEFPEGYLRRCLDKLAPKADVRWYTTPVAMDDLNEIREALGYRVINLYGGSYGTRAALVYMRRHPKTVRSVVLRAVAPTNMRALLPAARHTQVAFEGLIRDCKRDPQCAREFPDLQRELDGLLDRLATRPESVEVSLGNETVQLNITRDVFAGTLQFLLSGPETASAVPAIVRQAATGDLRPFTTIAAQLGRVAGSWGLGMALTVLCSEDAVNIRSSSIAAATKGTILGGAKVRNQLAACAEWPRARLPRGYHDPTRSKAPVLMISGELDPVDGLELAVEAARSLPNSIHLIIPSGTHQPQFPGCIQRLAARFLDRLALSPEETACVGEISRNPFAFR